MRKGGEKGGTSGLDGTADVVKSEICLLVLGTRDTEQLRHWESKNMCTRNHKNHILEGPTLTIKECPQASRATTLHSRKVTWPCGLELFTTAGGGRMSWMTILQGPPTPRLPLPHIHSKSPLGFLSHNAVFPAYSRRWGSVCNKDSRSLCLGAPRCPLSHPLPTPMFPGSSSAPP